MSNITDQEINTIRLSVLDLIKSFFMEEPNDDNLTTWKEVIATLSQEKVSPTFDSAVLKLEELLSALSLDQIKEEYYELFTNPFSSNLVHMTLSYYADGHDFGQSLVDLRKFMLTSQIMKLDGLEESEDSLVFLLDILSTLIKDEENEPDSSRLNQSRLLNNFLSPFSTFFTSALTENQRAEFYKACALFLAGYIDLEKGLMVEI